MERLARYDVFAVPTKLIYVRGDFNCRNPFTILSLKSLADNIHKTGRGIPGEGLEFPIVLQRRCDTQERWPEGYDFGLVAGFRRLAAVTTLLKWDSVPSTIREGLTDRDAEILNVTENLERKDLNPLEEAQALARRFPKNTPLREIADAMNRDTHWVHQRLRVMQLPEDLRDKVAAKLLTLTDVDVLVKLPPDEQITAAEELIAARGKNKRKLKVNPAFRRKFKQKRGKQEVNARIAQLMELGLDGLVTRFGAWFAGYISDDDFDADINAEILAKYGQSAP